MVSLDPQVLRGVAGNLSFLKEEWDEDISNDSLRLTSTVLRVLLVENLLMRAWRAAGFSGQLLVEAQSLSRALGQFGRQSVRFALAGGGRSRDGFIVDQVICWNRLLSEEEQVASVRQLRAELVRPYRLSEFTESTCIFAAGTDITRREVIQYVANKLGAHLDPRRQLSKPLERKFTLLDRVRDRLQVAGRNAIYYELLSIGQCLNSSKDVQALRDELARRYGDRL